MGQGNCYNNYYYYYYYYYYHLHHHHHHHHHSSSPPSPLLLRATTTYAYKYTLRKNFLNPISARLRLLCYGIRTTMLNMPTSINRTVYNPRTRQSSDFAQRMPPASGNNNFLTFPEHCLRTVQVSHVCSNAAISTQATRSAHFLVSTTTVAIPTVDEI